MFHSTVRQLYCRYKLGGRSMLKFHFIHYIQDMNRHKLLNKDQILKLLLLKTTKQSRKSLKSKVVELLVPNCHPTNHHTVQCLHCLEETMKMSKESSHLPKVFHNYHLTFSTNISNLQLMIHGMYEFQTESAKSSMVIENSSTYSLYQLEFTSTVHMYSDENNNYLELIHITQS